MIVTDQMMTDSTSTNSLYAGAWVKVDENT